MIVSKKHPCLNEARKVYDHLKPILNRQDKLERDKEHFYVIILDARNKAKTTELVSMGTLNTTLVHPREVFRRAIHIGGFAIIIAHNHPTGVLEPSRGDIETTERLKEVGKLVGIELVDHVIIGDGYKSIIN